jgi:hypothetical protein
VEACSSISTAALRVVGGDGKETHCLGRPVPVGYMYMREPGLPGWEELGSEAVKCVHESCGTQT